MRMNRGRRRRTVLGAAIVAAWLVTVGTGTAATPVQGSIAGPVTSVKGATFTVKTSLSPTGSSLVKANAKTTISKQESGSRRDLRKRVCVTALGTTKGKTVVATRVTLTAATGGTCGAQRGIGGPRQAGTPRPGAGQATPSPGRPFRPAIFGFAAGEISSVKGSTATVKGRDGSSTTVTVSAKTEIVKTVRVGAGEIAIKDCAFVRGTSTDKGATVLATSVSLSAPVNGTCTPPRRPRPSN